MQIVPSTRSLTSRQASQPPISPPLGQADRTPPVHEFMHRASNIYTLSGQIIVRSEIIIIWPLSVYVCWRSSGPPRLQFARRTQSQHIPGDDFFQQKDTKINQPGQRPMA